MTGWWQLGHAHGDPPPWAGSGPARDVREPARVARRVPALRLEGLAARVAAQHAPGRRARHRDGGRRFDRRANRLSRVPRERRRGWVPRKRRRRRAPGALRDTRDGSRSSAPKVVAGPAPFFNGVFVFARAPPNSFLSRLFPARAQRVQVCGVRALVRLRHQHPERRVQPVRARVVLRLSARARRDAQNGGGVAVRLEVASARTSASCAAAPGARGARGAEQARRVERDRRLEPPPYCHARAGRSARGGNRVGHGPGRRRRRARASIAEGPRFSSSFEGPAGAPPFPAGVVRDVFSFVARVPLESREQTDRVSADGGARVRRRPASGSPGTAAERRRRTGKAPLCVAPFLRPASSSA